MGSKLPQLRGYFNTTLITSKKFTINNYEKLASMKYELYNALGRLLCPRKQLENNVYYTSKAKDIRANMLIRMFCAYFVPLTPASNLGILLTTKSSKMKVGSCTSYLKATFSMLHP